MGENAVTFQFPAIWWMTPAPWLVALAIIAFGVLWYRSRRQDRRDEERKPR